MLYPPEINFSEGSEDVPYVCERINPVSTGTYHQTMGNHPFFADRELWMKPNDSESKYSLWGLGRWIGIDREHECFEEKFLKVCEEGSWEMQLMRFPLILEFMWKSGTGKWYTAMAVYHKPRGLLFRIGNVLGGENDELEMKCWSIPTQFDESMTELSADEIKGAIARTLTGKLFPRNTAKRGGGTISKCGMNLRRGLKVIDACVTVCTEILVIGMKISQGLQVPEDRNLKNSRVKRTRLNEKYLEFSTEYCSLDFEVPQIP